MPAGAWAQKPSSILGQQPQRGAAGAEPRASMPGGQVPRWDFMLAFLRGCSVQVETATGESLAGVFDSITAGQLHLKMVLQTGQQPGFHKPQPLRRLPIESVLRVVATGVGGSFARNDTSSSGGFQTDSDISKGVIRGGGRDLQAWADDDGEDSIPASAVKALGNGSGATSFDQFKTHMQMTGQGSTYSEDHYTTSLDTSKMTPEQLRNADFIAKQIDKKRPTKGKDFESAGEETDEKYASVARPVNKPWAKAAARGAERKEELERQKVQAATLGGDAGDSKISGVSAADSSAAGKATEDSNQDDAGGITLNPDAAEFQLNAEAAEFVPSFSALGDDMPSGIAAPPMQPQPYAPHGQAQGQMMGQPMGYPNMTMPYGVPAGPGHNPAMFMPPAHGGMPMPHPHMHQGMAGFMPGQPAPPSQPANYYQP